MNNLGCLEPKNKCIVDLTCHVTMLPRVYSEYLTARLTGVCALHREDALAQSVAMSMQMAAKSSGDRAAAAKAAVAAFEMEMDVAVRVGWAYVEALAFRIFTEVRSSCP